MFNLAKFIGGFLGGFLLVSPLLAEPLQYKLGRIATDREIAGWDISIGPDGSNLPEAKGTVLQGEKLYQTKCAYCHGEFGEAVGRWPVLMGGEESLATTEPEKRLVVTGPTQRLSSATSVGQCLSTIHNRSLMRKPTLSRPMSFTSTTWWMRNLS